MSSVNNYSLDYLRKIEDINGCFELQAKLRKEKVNKMLRGCSLLYNIVMHNTQEELARQLKLKNNE